MADCDGFFEQTPFEPDFENAAVFLVRSTPGLSQEEKKWLIICWFDNTYGRWSGTQFDATQSRAKMSQFLSAANVRSFEQLFELPIGG